MGSDSQPGEDGAQERARTSEVQHALPASSQTHLPASSLSAAPASTQHNAEAFSTNSATNSDPFQAVAGATPIFHVRQPSVAGLSIYTGSSNTASTTQDLAGGLPGSQQGPDNEPQPRTSSHLSRPPVTARRSFDSTTNVLSPPSSVSSPMLGSLNDVTPLPSPIAPLHSPDLWKRITERASRSRGNSAASIARDDALLGPSALSHSPSRVLERGPSRKKKPYNGLRGAPGSSLGSSQDFPDGEHSRTRSVSEYTPDTLQNVRPRNVTLPEADVVAQADASRPVSNPAVQPSQFHREQDFTGRQQRQTKSALHEALQALPSPPTSMRSTADSEDSDESRDSFGTLAVAVGEDRKKMHYKALRRLGNGSFSQVVLATPRESAEASELVAIKIVRHDPSASDDERMETSIKREIEMLQKVSHPSLPHLMGYEDTPMRALLVLEYCAGGDLFDLATQRRDLLTHFTIQRIFAELVGAVSYLHELNIVHRDIKLENVLCNIAIGTLETITDTRTYPVAIVTLTDLGLSRHIDPVSPLLSHPCGSTDYAAPELLLGQQYDGRATDSWALGILLYALLEGRLPFDPLPGKRNTGSVKHRIARCDWLWCTYGDRYGDWVEEAGRGLEGARAVTEGLLKKVGRGRWTLAQVQQHEWTQAGVQLGQGQQLGRAPQSQAATLEATTMTEAPP